VPKNQRVILKHQQAYHTAAQLINNL